jgi:hypothetical protein
MLLLATHCDLVRPKRQHAIELRATGTLPQALVQRIVPGGTSIGTQTLPWSTAIVANDGELVTLRVGAETRVSGSVRCEILEDGVVKATLDANGDVPTAFCVINVGQP